LQEFNDVFQDTVRRGVFKEISHAKIEAQAQSSRALRPPCLSGFV
jgi:hypothetical protein